MNLFVNQNYSYSIYSLYRKVENVCVFNLSFMFNSTSSVYLIHGLLLCKLNRLEGPLGKQIHPSSIPCLIANKR